MKKPTDPCHYYAALARADYECFSGEGMHTFEEKAHLVKDPRKLTIGVHHGIYLVAVEPKPGVFSVNAEDSLFTDYFKIIEEISLKMYRKCGYLMDSASYDIRDERKMYSAFSASVHVGTRCELFAHGNSSVYARGHSKVNANDYTHVIASGHSKVFAHGNATVLAGERAKVLVEDTRAGVNVTLVGNAECRAASGTIRAQDDTLVILDPKFANYELDELIVHLTLRGKAVAKVYDTDGGTVTVHATITEQATLIRYKADGTVSVTTANTASTANNKIEDSQENHA
jgi:hypothetical protein